MRHHLQARSTPHAWDIRAKYESLCSKTTRPSGEELSRLAWTLTKNSPPRNVLEGRGDPFT